MRLIKISIENFRGIKELKDFELKDLSLLVGENGASKTSILEAINFCLSPYFLSGRIKNTDFYKGEDVEIKIVLEFDENFRIFLLDGYSKQEVECNKVCLAIKKRDRAAPNKAFSDIVVISHYVLPNREKDNQQGWEIIRGTKTKFKFNERQLSFPLESEGLPRSFYFPKNRDKQLQKGFNSSISSVFDDFNWRFNKEVRRIENDVEYIGEKFTAQKNNFETSILEKIDVKSQEKTFQTLNDKLNKIGLPKADISLIDCNAPFESAFLSQKLENLDLPISQLGSGVEMVVSLLFLETMAEISKENILILIDEPELHLHPTLQNSFIDHIVSTSDTNQFLLSTHSPLFVKQTLNNGGNEIKIHSLIRENDEVKILELEKSVLDYVSANEINFIAFALATEEYHNELYEELFAKYGKEEREKKDGTTEFVAKGIKQFDIDFFQEEKKEEKNFPWKGNQNEVSIHTFLRNQIHHQKDNGKADISQLKQSIKKMRNFLNII